MMCLSHFWMNSLKENEKINFGQQRICKFAYTHPNPYGLRILAERYTKADTIEGEMGC